MYHAVSVAGHWPGWSKWEIVRKYFPHPIMSSSIHCPGGGQGPGTFLAFIFGAGRNNSSGGVIYLVGKIFGQVGLGWAGLGWAGWAGLGAGGNIE